MRRAVFLAAFLAALSPASPYAETRVQLNRGRLTIYAKNASIPEILSHIRDKTGMRIIYDGAPPQEESIQLAITDETPVAAIVGLLEHRAIKYAMVLDGSGSQIDVLLITTAPPPPRQLETLDQPLQMGDMGNFEEPERSNEPPPPVNDPATLPPPVPPPDSASAPASTAPTPQPWAASPFTPQGPGPIILPGTTPTPQPEPTSPTMGRGMQSVFGDRALEQ